MINRRTNPTVRRLPAAAFVPIALLIVALIASPCPAGPPDSDLPKVRMPQLRQDRPRLVFRPDGSDWPWTFARLKQLYRSDPQMRRLLEDWLARPAKADPSPAASALRYRLTGDEEAAKLAIEKLTHRPWEKIGSEYYSNGWEYALAYDWLYDHPSITPDKRRVIEVYLVGNARRALELLRDESWDLKPSLWHGRTKIANLAMVVALTLQTAPEAAELQRELARFFADACRALRLSEGWPEGYAYWLGNRSFPFALAVDCWRTATGKDRIAGIDLIEMIRRTGYWHLYGMRPDNRFLLYGDVFQGVRIDYLLRAQTMDYYARITRDPYLQAFALHGHRNTKRPYYRGNAWVAAIAFDPTVPLPAGSTKDAPLRGCRELPQADLFGPGAYNLAVMRDGWQPDSTMISFRAGAVQVHHAHYNAGTFTIFKNGPLAILSGGYAGFGTEHRQYYYIRSVAANCPLILAPGERLATRRHYNKPACSSGGQRLVIPTGSDVESSAYWRRVSQPGGQFAAGRLIAFHDVRGKYTYTAADLTCAYNSTFFHWPGQKPKVRKVKRAILWLKQQNTLLVYDRIESVSKLYQKKWLLHTINKPVCNTVKVLKGSIDDGILATFERDLKVTNAAGQMLVRALLPRHRRWLLVGGPNYRFYVECDGDQRDGFDGKNMTGGLRRRSYFDLGNWRAELEPTKPSVFDDFLVAIAIGSQQHPARTDAHLVGHGQDYAACQVGGVVVIFCEPPTAGPFDRTVALHDVRPASSVIVCMLGEPQAVPVDAFEPVRPEPNCVAMNLPEDKKQPTAITIRRNADGRLQVRLPD